MANETNIYFFSSVHGFETTNISADEGSLDEMVTVRLYLKGNASSDPGPPQCQNFIFNIICRDINTGETERMYVISVYYASISTIQSDLVKQSGWSGFGLTTFCTGSSPTVCNYDHSINE